MSKASDARDDVVKGVEKAASAILGLLSLSEERAKQMFDTLVEKGAEAKAQRSSVVAKILAQAEAEKAAILKKARDEFSAALSHMNFATKDDIARLEKLINSKLQ